MTNTATTPALALLPPRFDLGQTVTTPGALDACSLEYMHQCLMRHMRGDWGCVCAEDGETNDQALVCGNRILSSYPLDPAKPCEGLAATLANASGWYGRDSQVSSHTDGKSPVLGPCRTIARSRIFKPFWHMLLWPDSRAALRKLRPGRKL